MRIFGILNFSAPVSLPMAVAGSSLSALFMGGFFVLARYGIQGPFSATDLTFFRYASGFFLLPILLFNSPATLGGIGWRRGLVLAVFGGAAFAILLSGGLAYAPVAHGGVFAPGTVPIFAAGLSWLVLGDRLTRARIGGLVLVATGLATLAGAGAFESPPGAWRGDLMFVASAVLWAVYTVGLRAWKIDPLMGLTVVAVINAALFTPIYFLFLDPVVLRAGIGDWLVQGVYQCFIVGIAASVLYMRSIPVLGAARTALAISLVPVFAIVLAVPLLGELPGMIEAVGIVIVLVGVGGAMGVRLSGLRP